MDLADVLVKAEEVYHATHNIYIRTYQHHCPSACCQVSGGVSYYEPRRDRSAKSPGDLMGILTDTPATHTDLPEGVLHDTLLAPLTTHWRAWKRGQPSSSSHGALTSRPPIVFCKGGRAVSIAVWFAC